MIELKLKKRFYASLGAIGLLFIVGYSVGYQKGRVDEAAEAVAAAWLKIPLSIVGLVSYDVTNRVSVTLESEIDCGIIAALRIRENMLLGRDEKMNLDKVLGQALAHRDAVKYVYHLPPSIVSKLEKAKKDIRSINDK